MPLAFGRKAGTPFGVLVGVMAVLSLPSSAAAYTEKTLYAFCSLKGCKDGSEPMGELAMDASGNLYGTTYAGGHRQSYPGYGTVFEFLPGTGQYSELYKFCSMGTPCPDGAHPGHVRLVIDTGGNLYGATETGGNSNGGGVVFELVRKSSGWREKILYTFCSRRQCADGSMPLAGLTYAGAAAGELYDGTSPLYGTTWGGGANCSGDCGTVYSLTPKLGTKKWTESVLYSFCSQTNCADGQEPDSALTLDSAGNIYGTTLLGGQSIDSGTVFELSPNGADYAQSVLYSFSDGIVPRGGIVMDGAGNLFGNTEGGGSDQDGLIFELSPNGGQWQYSVLADFDGSNGGGPEGQLLLDAKGNLFGTTYVGGIKDKGTVFEFNGSLQSLYSFCPQKRCADGSYPVAGVIEDGEGNLFGTTTNGAHKNSGTIFELSVGH
ncbi:MAG TPA: choice-of-anchor tandem repeat GloVer-containing protein [Rhizomicrobium sp.]|jgi:uncharacterized repeat protein (TIGR03803 family)|nr:choice-of-anchor tandem repeat GloVer-containing protein [Rhizomicrobium sp.]